MDNKEIRRKILEYIYQKNEEIVDYYSDREELKNHLGIDDIKIDNNVLYLRDKGYLKLMQSMGAHFESAALTARGIDLVENPEEFNSQFPVSLIQIKDSTGVIIGNNNSQYLNIADSFNPIYEDIEKKNPKKKEQIICELKTIENELKKTDPKKSTIQKSLQFLRENAMWIVPTITTLINALLKL